MTKLFFSGLLIIAVLFVSGCVAGQRILPSEMAPMDTLNVYGTLVSVNQTGDVAKVAIAGDIINCNKNSTTLDIDVNTSGFSHSGYRRVINSANDLIIGKTYSRVQGIDPMGNQVEGLDRQFSGMYKGEQLLNELNITGLEQYIDAGDNYAVFGMLAYYPNIWIFSEQGFANATVVITNLSELPIGTKYYFEMNKDLNATIWWLYGVHDNMDIETCSRFHEHDMILDQRIVTEGGEEPGMVRRIIPAVIKPGQPTQLDIGLNNTQNYAISYTILDAAIADDYVWFPSVTPTEEEILGLSSEPVRLENAKLAACSIDFPAGERTVAPQTLDRINFTVTCNEPISCVTTYNGIDINGDIVSTTAPNCSFTLWAAINFTDSIGLVHTIPSTGIAKQFLEIEGH